MARSTGEASRWDRRSAARPELALGATSAFAIALVLAASGQAATVTGLTIDDAEGGARIGIASDAPLDYDLDTGPDQRSVILDLHGGLDLAALSASAADDFVAGYAVERVGADRVRVVIDTTRSVQVGRVVAQRDGASGHRVVLHLIALESHAGTAAPAQNEADIFAHAVPPSPFKPGGRLVAQAAAPAPAARTEPATASVESVQEMARQAVPATAVRRAVLRPSEAEDAGGVDVASLFATRFVGSPERGVTLHQSNRVPTTGGDAAAGANTPDEAGAGAAEERPRAAGQFEVDPDAAERALERTLVAEGALLLRPGQFEVEPSVRYLRDEQDDIPFPVSVGGDLVIANQRVRRDDYRVALDARAGLPFDSQFEVSLPYQWVDSDRTANLGPAGRFTSDESGSGFNDLSLGVAKTIFRERGWRPDLIARVTWDTGTGNDEDNGVALDGGFQAVRGNLTVLKRQDPLAFVATASYQRTFENNDIEPGDELGLGVQAVLAASPETSLRFGFAQTFADNIKFNGDKIDNSNQTQGTLSIGASTILAQGVLLDASFGVGVNDDAPDYFVRFGLPIRFNTPIF